MVFLLSNYFQSRTLWFCPFLDFSHIWYYRWRPKSPVAITQLHNSLQPGQLWTCIWRQRGDRGHGYPRSCGIRTGWVCSWYRWQLERRNGWMGWGGYGRGRDGDRLSLWYNNLENWTLGTDPCSPLYYAPGLEHHHPIMSTLGEPGGRWDIYIYIYITSFCYVFGGSLSNNYSILHNFMPNVYIYHDILENNLKWYSIKWNNQFFVY